MARKQPAAAVPAVPVIDAMLALARANMQLAVANPAAAAFLHEHQGNPVNLAPRVSPASEWTEKMTTNALNAGDRWLARTTNPRKEPLAEARKKVGRYKDSMAKSLSEGRYEKGLASADEGAMYDTIRAVGADGYRKGIQARSTKIGRAIAKLQPLVAGAAAALDAMPTDTDAQREAKMVGARRAMIEVGKKYRG